MRRKGIDDYRGKKAPLHMVIDPESTSGSVWSNRRALVNTSTVQARLVINGFKWEGDDTIDKTFADAIGERLSVAKQNEIEPSPATGFGWGGYMPVSAETNPVVIE